VKSDEDSISVNNGWSWVAFNSLSVMSLDEALAGMDPHPDDIIKAQRGVAYYDNYEWTGSLKQLTPGLGYKIKSNQDRKFAYPVKTVSASRSDKGEVISDKWAARSQCSMFNVQCSMFTPVDYRNYPANMVLIAQVVGNASERCSNDLVGEASELCNQPLAGVELGVFAGDECREAAVTDERGMVYITIPGDEPCELTFRVSDGSSEFVISNSGLRYETDAVVGSPRAPFIINLGEATGISGITNDELRITDSVYDLQGRRVKEFGIRNSELKKGIYVVNRQKKIK
jgi:hypothetical protein